MSHVKVQMRTDDEVTCPACLEGKVWQRCARCSGSGEREAGDLCSSCLGAGEVEVGPCTLCSGSGVVSFALMRLHSADVWTRGNKPDWQGDDGEHPGVTVFSKAMWFRVRQSGLPASAGGIVKAEALAEAELAGLVRLTARNGLQWLFHGFAWGYLGEGPSGLACVLADAMPQRFPTMADARLFVSTQSFGQPWAVNQHEAGERGLVIEPHNRKPGAAAFWKMLAHRRRRRATRRGLRLMVAKREAA